MKIEPHLEAMLPQLELRVLHGPQAGSRLTLSIGDYVLGTDDECEVMLAGPRLQGAHARLQFDGDRASICPLEGSVVDAQGKEITENFPLALGMPIEMGGIWIAVDEVDAPWPSTETLIPQPTPASAPASPSSDAVAAASESLSGSCPPADVPDRQRQRARRILIIAMSTLASLGVLGIAGAGWLASRQARTDIIPATTTEASGLLASLNTKLAEAFPGRSISVVAGAGGMQVITAYATDKAMADRMEMAIRKHAVSPQTHLFRDDKMLESAGAITQKFGQEGTRAMVEVSKVNNGIVTLRGTVISNGVREELLEALRANLPGLRGIEPSLRNAEELPMLLTDRIASAGLSKKLQILSQQPDFSLRGTLTDEEMQRWESLLLEFSREFGRLLPIRASINVQQRRPPIDIQTVVGGPMPFIITESGQRISVGGQANGHTVSAIRDNEVIFDGTQRYRLPR
jgi:type III secretion system YscD/HrpQ family protein